MIGFGIIGQTVSKDPMFNFPRQSMQAGNSYDIGNLLKTNQPTIVAFNTGGYPVYILDFDRTNLPLEVFQTYECFPLFKYYHPVMLMYPVENNVAMFYDTFRGFPSINLFPPVYQVLTDNSPLYAYTLPRISYSFLSLHMYYVAKYNGKPLQYRTVSYTPAYITSKGLVPLSGNLGYNGWAVWEI
jgi:hypothetical protein